MIPRLRKPFLLLLFLTALPGVVFASPNVDEPAPDFRLQDQQGEWHSLSDYRGRWLTVYFYPKDDTPGCTKEACAFRDNFFAFEEINAAIVGISVDTVESHQEFASKYKLPFTILADNDGTTGKDYGVIRNFIVAKFARRESFVIDPDGIIKKHYASVNPSTHTQEVINDLKHFIEQSKAATEENTN